MFSNLSFAPHVSKCNHILAYIYMDISELWANLDMAKDAEGERES